MTALATSFSENGPLLDSSSKREPSIRRKRLHLLYLVNDILHHAKYRINDASICGKLQPILMSLFGAAASFRECPKHHQKIVGLLLLWEENGYYSVDYIDKLREAVKNASELGILPDYSSGVGTRDSLAKTNKSAPFVMPAMHGEPSTPWFDLPAGNLMPHIIPNSTRPINPDRIKPLKFVAGPADEVLILAVKGLLDDVQKIFGGEADQDERVVWDIDELGQPIILDEITGDVVEGEGYYGWSRTFCEKMKRRRNGHDIPDHLGSGDRRSRSGSSSPSIKRRRYSRSDDDSSPVRRDSSHARRYSSSRSGSRSRSRSRSRNRSYSKSPGVSPKSPRRTEISREARLDSISQQHQFGLPQKPPGLLNQQVSFQNGFNGSVPPPPAHTMPFNTSQSGAPYSMPQNPPNGMLYNGANQPQYGTWVPPPPPAGQSFLNSQWPPPPPPGGPPFQQQSGGYAPPGPGGWQPQMQSNMAGRGGWQPPTQSSSGRGFNNNGWSNGPHGRGGRGNFRGRGW